MKRFKIITDKQTYYIDAYDEKEALAKWYLKGYKNIRFIIKEELEDFVNYLDNLKSNHQTSKKIH